RLLTLAIYSIPPCLWDFLKDFGRFFSAIFPEFSVIVLVAQRRHIVSCSYCGKVIGAFRLLRDSEFCCDLHRRQYGERLDKAVHKMASLEPAPPGVAGFRDEMPLQPGNCSSTLIPWLTTAVRGRIRTGKHWPLTLDTSPAMSGGAVVCECAPVEFPRPGERRLPDPVPALTLLVPDFTAALDPTPCLDLMAQAPARCNKWMAAPAPE